jgi:hypothetical protein
MRAVETSPMMMLTATTATSMMFIGSRSCCSATAQVDGGFSPVMRFGPYRFSRSAASPRPRPRSASVPNAATTASAVRVNHCCSCTSPASVRWSTVLVRSIIAAPQECRQADTAGRPVHRCAAMPPTPHPSGMVFGGGTGLPPPPVYVHDGSGGGG